MKVGLFLFGEVRTGVSCVASLKRFLRGVELCDVYASLWSSPGESSWRKTETSGEMVVNSFKKYTTALQEFSSLTCELACRDNLASTPTLRDGFYKAKQHEAQVYMFRSIMNALSLCNDYNKYDTVIITRPDCYFRTELKSQKPATCMLSGRPLADGDFHAYDVIMQLPPELVTKEMFAMYENEVDWQSEFPWLDYLKSQNIHFEAGAYKWGKEFALLRSGLGSKLRVRLGL